MYFISLVCLSMIAEGWNAPSKGTYITTESLNFLSNFGYYKIPDSSIGELANEIKIGEALERLQSYAGIPVTGILDEKTKELIHTPRCGMPDMSKSMKTRKRRYTLQGSYWKKSSLTWKLMNNNNDGLSRAEIENVMQTAFSKWQQVTNLQFYKLDGNDPEVPDIEVKFITRYHGDPYPFDGPGGTLAHAFYPHMNEGLSGDVHFDDDEVFTIGSASGRSLLWVAVHEIGHSIGLEHSNEMDSIMYPWYRGFKGNDFPLTYDDIVGIQNLYGSRAATEKPNPTIQTTTKSISPVATTTAKKPITPSFCVPYMKAVIMDPKNAETYIINDKKAYILDKKLTMTKGPIPLNEIFLGTESADSAYRKSDGRIVLFTGKRYSIYNSFSDRRLIETGDISKRYNGLLPNVTKIDGAFVWPGNGRTYLFGGSHYYRYNEYRGRMDYGYPKDIATNWNGIPRDIDDVFVWENGATYFFKDSQYYRLNKDYVRVEDGYPKSITKAWSKCITIENLRSSGLSLHNKFHISIISLLAVFIAKFMILW